MVGQEGWLLVPMFTCVRDIISVCRLDPLEHNQTESRSSLEEYNDIIQRALMCMLICMNNGCLIVVSAVTCGLTSAYCSSSINDHE